jgi:imidazolonepropionase-like amidohydrolase
VIVLEVKKRYALINCNVISGKLDSVISRNNTILIEGSRIHKIGSSDEVKIPDGYSVIDLQNKYVMPGLINAHVHLFGSGKPMKALSGGNAQRRLLKFLGTNLGLKILDKIVAQNARTELYSGVTTVRSVGDFYYSDVRLRDNIEAGKILGPRLIVSGPAIAVTGGHGYGSFAVTSDSPWEGRKCVRKNIYEQVDFIKICVTGGVTDARRVGDAGRLEMTVEEVAAICDEAHKIGYLVAAHIESKEGIRTALKGGVDTIEHGSCLDDEIIGLFKNNPSSLRGYSALITTISPALPLYGLPASVTKLNKVSTQNSKIILEGMLAGTKQALEAGIKVGLGTDASCPFVTQYNTWRELEYIIKYVGVRPQRAIYNATYGNAEILGIDKETGTIEEGKSADILVLDANPYESIRVLSQPKMIFARGDIIDNPRIEKISTIDDVIDKIKL